MAQPRWFADRRRTSPYRQEDPHSAATWYRLNPFGPTRVNAWPPLPLGEGWGEGSCNSVPPSLQLPFLNVPVVRGLARASDRALQRRHMGDGAQIHRQRIVRQLVAQHLCEIGHALDPFRGIQRAMQRVNQAIISRIRPAAPILAAPAIFGRPDLGGGERFEGVGNARADPIVQQPWERGAELVVP